MKRFTINGAMLAAAVLVANPASADSKVLSGQEIKEIFSGSVSYSRVRGTLVQVNYDKDGSMRGATENGYASDNGKWWIKNDKYCRKWSRWLGGIERCFTIRRQGDKLEFLDEKGNVVVASAIPKK